MKITSVGKGVAVTLAAVGLLIAISSLLSRSASVQGGASETCASSHDHSAAHGSPAHSVPAPATARLTEEKAQVSSAQTTCPVMGGKISKDIFSDYDGKRVYFCCAGCPATFKKNPAKYVKALEEKGIVLDKTPEDPKAAPRPVTPPSGE